MARRRDARWLMHAFCRPAELMAGARLAIYAAAAYLVKTKAAASHTVTRNNTGSGFSDY